MTKKKMRLADLRIERVALVARGSNPHADIVFYKAHPDEDKETESMPRKVQKLDRKKLSKEESTSLDAILKKAGVEETDEDPAEQTDEEVLEARPAIKKMLADAAAAEKQAKDDLAKVKKGKKAKGAPADDDADPGDEDDEEAILKSVDPKVAALITKAQKAATDAKTAADAADKRARDAEAAGIIEKSIREEGDFSREFEPFVKHYAGKTDDNGRLLHRVKKALEAQGNKTDFAKVEALVKAGNVALEKLTKEIGDDTETTFGKAYDELKAKADALMAADTKGDLTFAKAFTKVSFANPDLVEQYKKEKKETDRGRAN